MFEAILNDDQVGAPTVGLFHPALQLGAVVTPGCVIGRIVKAGRTHSILAPRGASGAALDVLRTGTWVAYGDRLLRVGDAAIGEGMELEARDAAAAELPAGSVAVRADTDGTVYLRPEPGSPVFAALEATVATNATLALVEVMKTFSPVRSPVEGTVVRVCVDDGASVEAGEALFWVHAH